MKLLGIKKFCAMIAGFLQKIDFQGVEIVKIEFLHKKLKIHFYHKSYYHCNPLGILNTAKIMNFQYIVFELFLF